MTSCPSFFINKAFAQNYEDLVFAGLRVKYSKTRDRSVPVAARPFTGFFISENGYFITAHHALKDCLHENPNAKEEENEFSKEINCTNYIEGNYNYFAYYKGKQYGISIISHISKNDSLPDDVNIVKTRVEKKDVIVGKVHFLEGIKVPSVSFSLPDGLWIGRSFIPRQSSKDDFFVIIFPFIEVVIPSYSQFSFKLKSALVTHTDIYGSQYYIFQPDASDISKLLNNYIKSESELKAFTFGMKPESGDSGSPVLVKPNHLLGVYSGGNDKEKIGILYSRDGILDTFFTSSEIKSPLLIIKADEKTYYLKY